MNLFIIGNGFDLSHGLKTSYNDFRRYLVNYCEYKEEQLPKIPEPITEYDGDISYDDQEVVSMLIYLIDQVNMKNIEYSENNDCSYSWADVEKSLGELEYDSLFEGLPDVYEKNGDIDDWKTAYMYEDNSTLLINPVTSIQSYFESWISTIPVNGVEENLTFKELIKKDDQFLVFNYTPTIQEVYDIPYDDVCHIHGTIGEKIVLGHGDNQDAEEKYNKIHIGAVDSLTELHLKLKKDVEKCFQIHIGFFNNLKEKDLQNVYSYGFNYGDVDLYYFEKLFNFISTDDITWFFDDYKIKIGKEKELEDTQRKLREIGFQGSFDIIKN